MVCRKLFIPERENLFIFDYRGLSYGDLDTRIVSKTMFLNFVDINIQVYTRLSVFIS